jgi:uncharacterized protein YycO
MIGDIWLTRTYGGPGFKGWLSRQMANAITFIKRGKPHTKWNHAALDVGEDFLIEATSKGVRVNPKSNYLDSPTHAVIVNRSESLNKAHRDLILDAAMEWNGVSYSWLTVTGHLFGRKVAGWFARRNKDKICSELVAEAYADGIMYRFLKRKSHKTLDPSKVRPRDIAYTMLTDDRWKVIYERDPR